MTTEWDKLTAPAAHAATGPLTPPADLRDTVLNKPLAIPENIQLKLKAANMPLSNDGVLMLWQKAKTTIQEATAFEMEMRKLAVSLIVPKEEKKEGTNNVELGNGFVAKAVIKFNRKLKAEDKKDIITTVDDCIDDFAKIDNEGSFIADRLFKWSVEISVAEFRKLEEEAETSPVKAALFARVQRIMEVTEAAPTLEIKEKKGK